MKTDYSQKHILIIGGMGPQASLYAHKLILDIVAAKKVNADNADFPRITHVSINVEDFISNPKLKTQAQKYILSCLSEINLKSVTNGLIACNTVHLLFDDIQKVMPFKLTSLLDICQDFVNNNSSIHSLGLLATPTTITSGIYNQNDFTDSQLIYPNDTQSKNTESIIREVIKGSQSKSLSMQLEKEIAHFIEQGADKVIMGCTELSLVAGDLNDSRVIDPLQLAIEHILS